MAGAEAVLDLAVVLAALVLVLDQQGDRGAGGQPLEGAGENADLVRLLPLRDEAGGAGAAAIEEGLDIGFGQRQPRRAAIDDAADGGAMGLAQVVTRKRWPKLLWDIGRGGQTVLMSGASTDFIPTTWKPLSTWCTSPVTPADRSLSR